MGTFFHIIIYQPLFNVLVALYKTIAFHDLGIAIILLTIIIRLLLYPFFSRFLKHQAAMQKIQPEVQKIQREHHDNREAQTQALMALYRTHNVSPFGGMIFLIIQLPILWGLYQLFRNGFAAGFRVDLYSFLTLDSAPAQTLLGLINLAKPNILVIGFAALAQYAQAKLSLPPVQANVPPEAGKFQKMSRQMVFLAPLLTLVFFYNLPAALGFYWATTSLFSAVQQFVIKRKISYGNLPGKSEAPR